MRNLIITLTLLPLFLGCQSASNMLHTTIMPKSKFLQNSELGLQNFYQSKHIKAKKQFQEAVDIYRIDEDKAEIAVSKFAIFDYHGEGYDRVLLHNYSALNYLLMGDLENAMVETKNSNLLQENERQKFYDAIKNFKKTEDKSSIYLDRYEDLFKSVNPAHNPYQNPFAYYVSALLYEEDGKYDEALIDIKNALKFYDVDIFREKLQLYRSAKSSQRVELFFDLGNSPTKEQINVSIKTDKDKKDNLYLPTFKIHKTSIDKIIITDSNDKIVANSSLLCDIDAIKVNEFKKKLPSLLGKFTAECGKLALNDTLSKTSSSLGAVSKTFTTIYSQNNLMTWKNLPKRIDVISFTLKENESYNLKVIDKNGKIVHNQKLKLECSKKHKNCYGYYRLK